MNWMRKMLPMILLAACMCFAAAAEETDASMGTPPPGMPAASPTPGPSVQVTNAPAKTEAPEEELPQTTMAVYRYVNGKPGSMTPVYKTSTSTKTYSTGFPRGTLVVVHEYANGRAHVTFGGWDVWIDVDDLTTQYPATGETVGYKYAYHASGSVTLYKYESDQAIAVIPNGAKVAITDMREGNSTYVMFGATQGWARNSDLVSKLPEDVDVQQGVINAYRKLIGDTPGQRVQLYTYSSCNESEKAITLPEGTSVMVCRLQGNVCIQYNGREYWVKPRNLYSQLSGNNQTDDDTAQGDEYQAEAAPEEPREDASAAAPDQGEHTAGNKGTAAASKRSDKKASATPTPAPTAVPVPDAYIGETGVAIVSLGSRSSVVTTDGGEMTIATKELVFPEDIAPDKAVAYIHAPRSGSCRLRAKASDKGDVLYKCPAGTVVRVLEYGKSYCKISINGMAGYVQTACLVFCDPSAETVGTVTLSYQGKVNGRTEVPVRNSRDMSSAIVARWVTGTVLEVISRQGVWYEVEHEGVHGYVHKNYLTVNE